MDMNSRSGKRRSVPLDERNMPDADQLFRNLLDKVAAEQGYQNPNITATKLPNIGANFTSFLYEATISAEGKEDLNLFGKVACVGEEFRAMAPIKVFEVEGYFYEHLLATYKKLEEDHKVPQEDRLLAPAFYGCHPTFCEETIVLENLKKNGYETLDRFEVLSWEYASKAVRELAKLHALSFAFKHEYPDLYDAATKVLKIDWAEMMKAMGPMMQGIMSGLLALVNEEHRPKLEQFQKSLMSSPEDLLKYYSSDTVLKHGDFRASNLMHKVDKDGKLSVIPIDYQTIQLGEPVTDLFYLVFSGTDAAFRREHWRQLLDYYFAELAAAMTRLDLDPEETYSKTKFEDSVKEMMPYGLVVALSILGMVLAEKLPEVSCDNKLEDMMNLKGGELYKERINGIVEDYVQWGYL